MEQNKIQNAVTIDEALTKIHFGKFNYFIIIFSGLVLNNVILESVGVSFALPILGCDLNLSYKQQGILGSVGFIGIIISSHLWGFLADTTGRKRILRPALILECLITILSSLSPNFETLAVMRFLNGVLLSAGSASIFAYLGEFHSHQYRNRAILSAAFISAILAIFFPLIAWVFINQSWSLDLPFIGITFKPWRLYMLACGTGAFITTILLFFLPESPKYLLSIGRIDKAIAILKRIHHINVRGNPKLKDSQFEITNLLPDNDTPVRKFESETSSSDKNIMISFVKLLWNQTVPLFMREHLRKTVLASVIQFIIFFSAHGVYMWFPYILNRAMLFTQRHSHSMRLCDILRFTQSQNFSIVENANESSCGMQLESSTYQHTLFLELIYVGLLIIVSCTIGKFGRNPMLFIILATCGVCGIIGLIIKIPIVAIYFLVILLCCGLGTTVVNAIVVDIYPTNLRAMAVCISLMFGRIGSVSGSSIMGILIESNCELGMYSSAVSLIIAGCLGVLLPRAKHVQEIKPQKDEI